MRWLANLFSTALLLTLVAPWPAGADEEMNSCVSCHEALPDELGAPVEGMKTDVHGKHGLSCADCHGGDPNDVDMTAMSPESGYRGAPSRAEVPDFCARCHSDPAYMRRYDPSLPTNQRERYWTSVHGARLRQGDEKVATCTSCHGVHGILAGELAESPVYPANIPATCGHCHSKPDYMKEYDIPTNQEEKYRGSVHGKLLLQKRDLSAPMCSTCHDNHGASPPGLTSIADVCGQCHVNNAAFFKQSPHKTAFDAQGFHECAVCHDQHAVPPTSDAMLGVGDKALCGECHREGSAGYQAAVQMRRTVDELEVERTKADHLLDRAESLGMEVSDARYEFHSTDAILIQARTSVHLFSPEKLEEAARPGIALAHKTQLVATSALEQARARRRNLLFPLVAISVLMILLWLKLRRLERR